MKSALGIVRKYHPDVTTVVDAKKRIDIEVTATDARHAQKKSPSTCALAKAFCRTFDGAVISVTRVYLIDGEVATRYLVPPSVSRELVSFDRHNDFAPGHYSLSPPGKFEQLGSRRYNQPARRPKKKRSKDSKLRSHRTTGIRAL